MKPCCNPVYITVNTSTRKKKSHRVMMVPCGHCVNCLANNQRDWVFRMKLEMQVSDSAYFVTLTLDDEHLGDNTLKKKHLQDFVRLLRQKVNRECDRIGVDHLELRYFGVGEYGKKTNRAHYHIMLFNLPFHDKIFLHNLFAEVWKKGFVYVEDCVAKNIGYICKYITKLDPRQHEVDPFRLMSLRPAIGMTYFRRFPDMVLFLQSQEKPILRLPDGYSYSIPRTLKKVIFTEDQKIKARLFMESKLQLKWFSEEALSEHVLYMKSLQEYNERQIRKLKRRFIDVKL